MKVPDLLDHAGLDDFRADMRHRAITAFGPNGSGSKRSAASRPFCSGMGTAVSGPISGLMLSRRAFDVPTVDAENNTKQTLPI